MISPGDLEWASLKAISNVTARRVGGMMGLSIATATELIRALGSKHTTHPKEDGLKHPWRRAVLAREIPPGEISEDSLAVLRRWLEGAMPKADALTIIRAARE